MMEAAEDGFEIAGYGEEVFVVGVVPPKGDPKKRVPTNQ